MDLYFVLQSGFNPSAHEFVPKSTPGPSIHQSASAPSFEGYHGAHQTAPPPHHKPLHVLMDPNGAHSPSLTPSASPQISRHQAAKSPQHRHIPNHQSQQVVSGNHNADVLQVSQSGYSILSTRVNLIKRNSVTICT